MQYGIGSIVLLERIIFKSTYRNGEVISKFSSDHSYSRPVMIIAEDSENTYFLPVTTKKCINFKKIKNNYPIGNIDSRNSYVCLGSIQKRNVCYREEIARLKPEVLLRVLQEFCEFQETTNLDPEYNEIKELIYEKINELNDDVYKKTKKLIRLKK
ncbi:MAG: hypothetical protein NC181_02670 [Clostridium sp.]|nr:hypothetical protein [Clostridium sp.]MCM1444135.1 hypothetical protein [Candidatus Amulumruptor caecigallinarius]